MKIYKHKEVDDIPIADIVAAARGNKQIFNIEIKTSISNNEEVIIVSPKPNGNYELIYDSKA